MQIQGKTDKSLSKLIYSAMNGDIAITEMFG